MATKEEIKVGAVFETGFVGTLRNDQCEVCGCRQFRILKVLAHSRYNDVEFVAEWVCKHDTDSWHESGDEKHCICLNSSVGNNMKLVRSKFAALKKLMENCNG